MYKESDSEVTDKMAYNKRQENMQMEKNVTGNIIELKGITKRYEDNFTAVEDFNLEVRKGEFVTFLGPSGCGKTTTLRMIAGFDIPTEGKILLNGIQRKVLILRKFYICQQMMKHLEMHLFVRFWT